MFQFKATYDKFALFYNQRHHNRKLDWHWPRCKGEIASHCFAKPYFFVAATMYQMGVLLLFNKSPTLSISFIVQECGIPTKESSVQVIQQLVKFKILTSSGDERLDETEITVNEQGYQKLDNPFVNLLPMFAVFIT